MSNRFSLDHLASFSIQGPDARAYAQSQFTVSVDALSADAWTPLAWCDPKGRVLAVMMGRASEDDVDLVLPRVQAEQIRTGLERFTIGRRVKVSGIVPVAGTFEPAAGVSTLKFDAARGMLAATEARPDAAGLRRWRRLDLCRGLPWLEPDSSGRHLPQWLGLEELGALAYDKGCYPGQEVIARLHYRGSVKYRLRGLMLDVPANPPANSRISGPGRDDRGAGHWLGGMTIDGTAVGLGVLATHVQEGDEVLIQEKAGPRSARVTPPEALC